MRTAFIKTLEDLAREDERIYLLTADLGFSVFERFMEEFPGRFINMGISEANMMGVATGLAFSGKKVFVYSIVPFVTMRCFEQVRVDVCYHDADVKIVGVGGGLSYGPAGATHHSIEDISLMRSLPGMSVICPGDPYESAEATRAALYHEGPVYIRLGKNGEPLLHGDAPKFSLGRGITMAEGKDLTLIATGNMLETARDVADELGKKGLGARLISMHTVKPLDSELIISAAKETRAVFTIEEHSLIGGLGSAVAETLMESDARDIPFRRIALPDEFQHSIGSQNYLREVNRISKDKIVDTVLKYLN